MNAPTVCTEKTCDGVDCGRGATCTNGTTDDDGYVCRCDDAYHADEAWNGASLTCIERTCDMTGFFPESSCGENALCTDLAYGDGIQCSCPVAFNGSTVTNGRTTCLEKTCVGVTCADGASCSEASMNDGYVCRCGDAYHPNEAWNGASLECTPRNCSNLDFESCGLHSTCENLGAGQGVECGCQDGYYGLNTTNEPTVCLKRQCVDVDCGLGASCVESGLDGYKCTCDAAYLPSEAMNGPVSCIERDCENSTTLGFESCGDNTTCMDLSTGHGILCVCESEAFAGVSVENAPASCIEKTLSLIHI